MTKTSAASQSPKLNYLPSDSVLLNPGTSLYTWSSIIDAIKQELAKLQTSYFCLTEGQFEMLIGYRLDDVPADDIDSMLYLKSDGSLRVLEHEVNDILVLIVTLDNLVPVFMEFGVDQPVPDINKKVRLPNRKVLLNDFMTDNMVEALDEDNIVRQPKEANKLFQFLDNLMFDATLKIKCDENLRKELITKYPGKITKYPGNLLLTHKGVIFSNTVEGIQFANRVLNWPIES